MENRMSETDLATVPAKPQVGAIPASETGLQLRSFDDMYRFAQAVVKSKDFAPRGLDTPEKVMLAVQTGMELGFSLMRSLSAVIIVNGRPGLYGEAVLALIHDRGVCSRPPVLTVEGEGDQRRGVCRFQRKDMPEPIETTFSVADAKKAGLWNKSNSAWQTYPDDMLIWRALARAAKRYFSDVTFGLALKEELDDYPAVAAPRSATPPPEPDPLLAGVLDATIIEPQAVPEPEPPKDPLESLRAQVEAVKEELRGKNTLAGISQVRKATLDLASELSKSDASLLDDLNAAFQQRIDELKGEG